MFEIMPFDRRSYSVSNYNPFRELQEMEKRFWGNSVSNSFRTDITETNDAYKLEADLPGFKKEDIKVDIDDDILVIKAEHSEDKDEKNDNGDYIRRERITASDENGVLTLTMPKKVPVKPESKHLEIM